MSMNEFEKAVKEATLAIDRFLRASSLAYAAGYRIENKRGRNQLIKK